jgi:predicted nucleotidyltransferase
LFGSQARNEATEKSDVDLTVELEYNQKIGWEFITMRLELEQLLQSKVDLISSEGMSPFIGPYIEAEKQLIYEHFTKRQIFSAEQCSSLILMNQIILFHFL